ncbi:DUF2867 domain-containing protein [Sneathiella glossodoripedis]|uniref:DUF2867 domain-containing protein n=1 Tax=Sneathiella glossodoripedis TaxID=418853 RepID=UPI0004706B3B|nr:DUF2867 domain-containing protein [Sneathiella glossodoripedis]
MILKSEIPTACRLQAQWDNATYKDCYKCPLDAKQELSAASAFHHMLSYTPKWVSLLMKLRNSIVRFIGLKTDIPNDDFQKDDPDGYRVGDFIGFFKVEAVSVDELIVSTNDRHLDAFFSVFISRVDSELYFVSTVKTKERRGDIYMFVIAPFHRLIVKNLLARFNRLPVAS